MIMADTSVGTENELETLYRIAEERRFTDMPGKAPAFALYHMLSTVGIVFYRLNGDLRTFAEFRDAEGQTHSFTEVLSRLTAR